MQKCLCQKRHLCHAVCAAVQEWLFPHTNRAVVAPTAPKILDAKAWAGELAWFLIPVRGRQENS